MGLLRPSLTPTRNSRSAIRSSRDKYDGNEVNGVLYPRAGCLGGCTAHNAQITVYPHNEDWDFVAQLTGDSSWSADNMRKYFQRMENCHHRPFYRFLAKFGINPTRHGFKGWLQTEAAIPLKAVAGDKKLFEDGADFLRRGGEGVGGRRRHALPRRVRTRWPIPTTGDW